MKKIIALLLCLLMAGTATLASCNKDDEASSADSNSAESSAADISEETSESIWTDGIVGYLGDGKWGREMPEFKWDREEFNILVYSNAKADTYYSEEVEPNLYPTTDSIINEAVALRNSIIFEKYGVEIKAVLCDDVYTTLKQQIEGGGDDCADAAMPFLKSCTVLAQNGDIYDLRDFEQDGYIDLSMPWWEKNATESLSIGNKVYFAVGDMSIMQKICCNAIMFNKDMLAVKHPELNLYQMVKDKEWTYDKMMELSKEYTYESDNEDGMTWTDTWGFGATNGSVVSNYLASGQQLVKKDENDLPMLALGTTERDVNVLQKLLDTMTEKNTWVITAEQMGGNIWDRCVKIFGEGRNLFRVTAFSAVKKIRVYDVNFGIVPYPLIDETQDEYSTPCGAAYAYGCVIPLSAPDPEFSAYMLDVMSAESKGDNAAGLTRAYIEVVIKGKDLKADEDACDILDNYVFNNIVYDLGLIYNFGIDSMINNLVANGSSDIISAIDANSDSINAKIEDVITLYNDR